MVCTVCNECGTTYTGRYWTTQHIPGPHDWPHNESSEGIKIWMDENTAGGSTGALLKAETIFNSLYSLTHNIYLFFNHKDGGDMYFENLQ
jgi:hypothetical protein